MLREDIVAQLRKTDKSIQNKKKTLKNLHKHTSERIREKHQRAITKLEIERKGLMLQLPVEYQVKHWLTGEIFGEVAKTLNRNPQSVNEIIFELSKEHDVMIREDYNTYFIFLDVKGGRFRQR